MSLFKFKTKDTRSCFLRIFPYLSSFLCDFLPRLGVRIPVLPPPAACAPPPRRAHFPAAIPQYGQQRAALHFRTAELKQELEASVPRSGFIILPRGKSPGFLRCLNLGNLKPVGNDSAATVVRKTALFPHRNRHEQNQTIPHDRCKDPLAKTHACTRAHNTSSSSLWFHFPRHFKFALQVLVPC